MEKALGFAWPGVSLDMAKSAAGWHWQLLSFLGGVHGLMSQSAGASSGFAVGLFPTPIRSQT